MSEPFVPSDRNRLGRARKLLQQRFTRRGITLPAGVLAALLVKNTASAVVPTGLLVSTAKAATLIGADQAVAVGLVSAKVAALTEGVLRAMLLKKLAVQTMVVAFALLVVSGGARLSSGFGADTKQPVNDKKRETITQVAQKPSTKEAGTADPRKSWRERSSFPTGALVRFSPDGKTLAVSGKTVNLYDLPSGQLRTTLEVPGGVIAFSPDSKTLATTGDKVVTLWDVATGKERGAFRGHTQNVSSMAFSPDGKTVASASRGEVKLWDAKARLELMVVYKDAEYGVNHVAFSPDGKALAMVSGKEAGPDLRIRLWDLTKKEERWVIFTLPGGQLPTRPHALVFSPDGKSLAVAFTPQVQLLDVATGQVSATLEGHKYTVSTLAFTPDGKTLASGSGVKLSRSGKVVTIMGQVKLWDTLTRKEITTIDCKMGIVSSVAFSPDGKILATGGSTKNSVDAETGQLFSEAGIVKLWEMKGAK